MAIEVSCGECNGLLLIEQAGVVVECPHCGVHLSLPEDTDMSGGAVLDETSAAETVPADGATPGEAVEPAPAESAPTAVPDAPVADAVPVVADASASIPAGAEPSVDHPLAGNVEAAPAVASPAADAPNFSGPDFSGGWNTPAFDSGLDHAADEATSFPQFGDHGVPADSAPTGGAPGGTPAQTVSEAAPVGGSLSAGSANDTDSTNAAASGDAAESATVAAAAATVATAQPATPAPAPYVSRRDMVPKKTFMILAGYASAMTLAAIVLFLKLQNPPLSNLESLPDIKPPKDKHDTIGYRIVPEAADMPPGHLLSLGEEQRYGNIRVTPLRVTRGPVEFVHHAGDVNQKRAPGSDVLKLWLRFENVSADQEIAPLDKVAYKRQQCVDEESNNYYDRSNNFVCLSSQKKQLGDLVLMYPLIESDVWDLKDQAPDYEIPPGEVVETYLATSEEGWSSFLQSDEPIVWRVHFRKGYSPQMYGVTTVIEVEFDASDIMSDSAVPASDKGPTGKTDSEEQA